MRSIIILIVCFLCASIGFSKTLTLNDAILLALRHNPNVINAHMTRTIDRYNLRVAEDAFALRYTLSGSAEYQATTAADVTTRSTTYRLSPQVSLTLPIGTEVSATLANHYDADQYHPTATFRLKQPLLRGARKEIVQSALQTAYTDDEVSKITLKNTLMTQINAVANQFFNLLQAKNNLNIQQQAYNDAEVTVSHNATLIRLGRLAPNENVQPKSQMFSRQLAVTQAQNQVFNAQQALLKQLGLVEDQSIDVTNSIEITETTIPSLQESLATAFKQNNDYQQSKYQLENQRRALLRAQDNLRWQLDLQAQTTLGSTSGSGTGFSALFSGDNRSYEVGLNLSIPIQDLSKQQALLQTKIALRKNQLLLKQQQRDLNLSVRNAINELSNQKQQMAQAIRAEQLAQRSLALEKKKVDYGLSTTINVETVRTAAVNASVNKINSQIGFLKARLVYLQLLGETLNHFSIKVKT